MDAFASLAVRDRKGTYMFSGFDLFTTHSCAPNLVYNHDKDEEEDWHNAYAARDIQAGDLLTVDYNTLHWDRSTTMPDGESGECHCGATQCTGTTLGFGHLDKSIREERKLWSWKRVSPPHNEKVWPGQALSPFVRVCWRKDSTLAEEAPETDPDDDNSSSSDED